MILFEKGTRETAMGAAICGSGNVHRMKKGPSWVSRESIHTVHHRGIASNEVSMGLGTSSYSFQGPFKGYCW